MKQIRPRAADASYAAVAKYIESQVRAGNNERGEVCILEIAPNEMAYDLGYRFMAVLNAQRSSFLAHGWKPA